MERRGAGKTLAVNLGAAYTGDLGTAPALVLAIARPPGQARPMSAIAALLSGPRPFLTLGGLETFLVFHKGIELREFCAFEVLMNDAHFGVFEHEFLWPTADVAMEHGCGLLVDCLLWRAAPDFVEKLGYARADVLRINRLGLERLHGAVSRWRASRGERARDVPIVFPGAVGPRGDGYKLEAGGTPTAAAAVRYHSEQLGAIAEAGFDLACAFTMTCANEAIGIVHAARELGLPIVVSPTLETDGRLPEGSSLRTFVERVDAASGAYPAGYMVNCVHPTHVAPVLAAGGTWTQRLIGIRANASQKSHAELDASTQIDAGNAAELARQVLGLRDAYGLRIIGGCCGTDVSHITAIARACGSAE